MRTLGILVNTQKPLAIQKAKHILSWGKTRGIQLLLPPHEASVLGVEGVSDESEHDRLLEAALGALEGAAL